MEEKMPWISTNLPFTFNNKTPWLMHAELIISYLCI